MINPILSWQSSWSICFISRQYHWPIRFILDNTPDQSVSFSTIIATPNISFSTTRMADLFHFNNIPVTNMFNSQYSSPPWRINFIVDTLSDLYFSFSTSPVTNLFPSRQPSWHQSFHSYQYSWPILSILSILMNNPSILINTHDQSYHSYQFSWPIRFILINTHDQSVLFLSILMTNPFIHINTHDQSYHSYQYSWPIRFILINTHDQTFLSYQYSWPILSFLLILMTNSFYSQ